MEKINDDILDYKKMPVWVNSEDDVVFCSSVSLNRNIKGFKFPYKATEEEREKVGAKILGKINKSELSKQFKYSLVSDMTMEQQKKIYERRISYFPELEDESHIKTMMILFNDNETNTITINGDDHLQVKVSLPGNCLEKCLKEANDLLSKISLEFCDMSPFGFLTSSPAIMGSGIQIESLIHIPATSLYVDSEKWMNVSVSQGFLPEGFFGAGSDSFGNIFTICNQNTHRKSQEELVNNLSKYMKKIIKTEKAALKEMGEVERKDVVLRAFGTLKYAQTIPLDECMSGLSLILMGINNGIINTVDKETVGKLMFYIFPTQLRSIMKNDPDSDDFVRARLVRSALKKKKEKVQ